MYTPTALHTSSSAGGAAAVDAAGPRTQLRQSLRSMSYSQGQEALQAKRSPEGEAPKNKANKPYTAVQNGTRTVLNPAKPNGKTLYFFYGYDGSKSEQKDMKAEAAYLEDDVKAAAARGFKVVYDKAGTMADFLSALYDGTCYGIYWSAHGDGKGGIWTSDGKVVKPADVDKSRVSKKIQYLILASSGKAATEWKKAVGSGCQFEGWVNSTYKSETIDFTSKSMLDSWSSHKGMTPGKELDDYVNDAAKAR